jgi:hypothetical protein
VAQGHAILECALIIGLSTFCLNVLLYGVDLRLILDELLLDVIESVVDVALQDLILSSVMLHRVISHLLLQTGLVLREHGSDGRESNFFPVEFDLEVICAGKLIRHLVLHLTDLLGNLLHFLLDPSLKSFDLLKVILPLFKLDLESRVGSLSIFDLSLLEGQLLLLILVLSSCGQIILPDHSPLHVLQQGRNSRLVIVYLTLVSGFLFFEFLHEIADFPLLLV